MPITIVNPLPTEPISPGVRLELHSDLVGPIDPTFVWVVELFSTDGETLLYFNSGVPLESGDQHRLVVQLAEPSKWIVDVGGPNVQAGAAVHLQAQIQSPDGSSIYDLSQGQQRDWSDTSSLYQWIRAVQSGGGTGGLTPEQAEQLATTFQSVTQTVTQGGTTLEQLLSDFMQQVPTRLLDFQMAPIVIDRDTSVDISSATGHLIYGYWVEFTKVPPGFGVLNGAFPEYKPRVAQIAEVATFLGTSLAVRVRDLVAPNLVYMWDFWQGWKPNVLTVSVTPGCEITIHLLGL